MNDQIVNFVISDPLRTTFEAMDKFKLREDRPAVWLQKVLFWMLRKLRCYAMDESLTMRRYTLETRKFMEQLYQQHSHLMDYYHLRGERLLIGAKDFADLMNDKELIPYMVSFEGSYNYQDRGHQSIMGMKITIVPWMNGIIVLPKELQ